MNVLGKAHLSTRNIVLDGRGVGGGVRVGGGRMEGGRIFGILCTLQEYVTLSTT